MRHLEAYTIVIRPDDNGTFVAYVPAIPGCHAWGQTAEEVREALGDVFEMILEEYAESGQALPDDVELTVAHAR